MQAMARVTLKYVQAFTDRHGKRRTYFRFHGKRWKLPNPDEASFGREYDRLLRTVTGAFEPKVHGKNSLLWLIRSYQNSPEYRAKKPRTLENYDRHLDDLAVQFGDKSWRSMTRRNAIEKIRDPLADTPGKADTRIKVLSSMYAWAVERDMIDRNPVAGIKPIYKRGDGIAVWTDEDIQAFARAAKPKEWLLFCLAYYTGQRRADLAGMTWFQIRDGYINLKQGKTDTKLTIWIHPSLAKAMDHVPGKAGPVIARDDGTPYTPNDLGKFMAAACKRAGVSASLHGLRKRHLTDIAEAGGSAHMLQSSGGHRTLSEVQSYTKKANQKGLAEDGIRKLRDLDRT